MTYVKITDDPSTNDNNSELVLKTLNSKLGYILEAAESMYGSRDSSYQIIGVFYTDEDFPHTWFPYPDAKIVAIRVMNECKDNLYRGLYQLEHEVIHCLAPHPGIEANVFEEGLATYFSVKYMDKYEGCSWHPVDNKYVQALKCIEKALESDSEIITKLIAKERNFANITENMIFEVSPEFPKDLANILTMSFENSPWIELTNKLS